MSYSFNCTYCGKELEQKDILFDLLNPLRNSVVDKPSDLNYLKLLVNEEKLNEIYNNGKALPDPSRSTQRYCVLSVKGLFELIGDKNNLNIPDLKNVDYAHLSAYIGDQQEEIASEDTDSIGQDSEAITEESSPEEKSEDSSDRLSRKERMKKAQEEKKAAEEHKRKELETHRAKSPLRKIITKQGEDIKSEGKLDREKSLCEDLKSIRDDLLVKIGEEYYCAFYIKLSKENVQGKDEQIITGYEFFDKRGKSLTRFLGVEVRQCPECREPVFKGAGTAPHKTVVFIGSPGTGKTSAMVALAHYSRYKHIRTSDREKLDNQNLWKTAESCLDKDGVISFVCGSSEAEVNLLKNMNLYRMGFAPEKTKEARNRAGNAQAFSITLNVYPEAGKRSFLSLMDIPGEVCDIKTGHIDRQLADQYSYLFSCDSYVLCFQHPLAQEPEKKDTENERQMESDMSPEDMVRNWANEIQDLRKEKNHSECNVPMLIAFTKCPNLEDGNGSSNQSGVQGHDPYLFKYDREAIRHDDNTRPLIDTIRNSDGSLNEGFYAYMRCSPFGFAARKEKSLDSTTETNVAVPQNAPNADETKGSNRKPEPKQIDRLMKWILCVSGCIPVASEEGKNAPRAYVVPHEYRTLLPEEKYAKDHGETIVKNSKPREIAAKDHFFYVLGSLSHKKWMAFKRIAYIRQTLFVNCSREKKYVEASNAAQFFQTSRFCFKERRRSLVAKGTKEKR